MITEFHVAANHPIAVLAMAAAAKTACGHPSSHPASRRYDAGVVCVFVIRFSPAISPFCPQPEGVVQGVVYAIILLLTMSPLMEFFRAVADESEVSDVLILLPTC